MKKEKGKLVENFILCYVEDGVAFFTNQTLEKQWGDDWNDTPYEHNAGYPYTPHTPHHKTDAWKIRTLVFRGALDDPSDGHLNSPFSVYDINKKKTPWLKTASYTTAPKVEIWAGTNMDEFCSLVCKSGGTVYFPMNDDIDFKLALKYGNFDNLKLIEALEDVRSR